MRKISKVLLTGGTGQLGRELLRMIDREWFHVDVLTRNIITETKTNVRYVIGDLTSGDSLRGLSTNYDVVIHSASNPKASDIVDIEGTRNLLRTINGMSVRNFVYISIVGVDKSTFKYYQSKVATEKLIIDSGIPYSILRVTQFHDFVYNRILNLSDDNSHTLIVPEGLTFQSIDLSDVCKEILKVIQREPENTIIEIGGPEVLEIDVIIKGYRSVGRLNREIYLTSDLNDFQKIFTTGINLCPDNKTGKITWREYLVNNSKTETN